MAVLVKKLELKEMDCFIPSELAYDGDVPATAIRVWFVLDNLALQGINSPSLREIARLSMMSTATARKTLNAMEKAGWLKMEKYGETGNIIYTLLMKEKEEEMPEIEVGRLSLANRKNNDLTAPRRKQFGRVVR